jgi:uncharacterized caspase-like protein
MEHTRTIYGLLVGIDTYPDPTPSLRGCANDIEHFEAFLHARGAIEGASLKLLKLQNEQATRQRVIAAFQQHLCQAGEQDVVVFYFSGHGSQSLSPPEFWRLEPDHLDETLVCYDSRTDGSWDLADKELAFLISKVAQRKPQIVVILDACHSGSGTRASDGTTIRRTVTDTRLRPIETFVPGSGEYVSSTTPSSSGWLDLPMGRHILLAACRSEEEARELSFGGVRRGVFSYYLLEALQQRSPALSYRDLFRCIDARVRATVANQSPQIEATLNSDLAQPFLGGAIGAGRQTFAVHHEPILGWVMDGGAIHGIAPPVSRRPILHNNRRQ